MRVLLRILDQAHEETAFFSRFLAISGIVLVLCFFLPWVYDGDNIAFSWHVAGSARWMGKFLALYPLIAGIIALFTAFFHRTPYVVRALIVFLMGLIPLMVIYTKDTAALIWVGQGSLFSFMDAKLSISLILLCYGCLYRTTAPQSAMARIAIGMGILFCFLAYLTPRELSSLGEVIPVMYIFKSLAYVDKSSLIIVLAAALLPLPLGAAAIALFPGGLDDAPSSLLNRTAIGVAWIGMAFFPIYIMIPFIVLLTEGVVVFYMLLFAVLMAFNFICVLLGGGILMEQLMKDAARWVRRGDESSSVERKA